MVRGSFPHSSLGIPPLPSEVIRFDGRVANISVPELKWMRGSRVCACDLCFFFFGGGYQFFFFLASSWKPTVAFLAPTPPRPRNPPSFLGRTPPHFGVGSMRWTPASHAWTWATARPRALGTWSLTHRSCGFTGGGVGEGVGVGRCGGFGVVGGCGGWLVCGGWVGGGVKFGELVDNRRG